MALGGHSRGPMVLALGGHSRGPMALGGSWRASAAPACAWARTRARGLGSLRARTQLRIWSARWLPMARTRVAIHRHRICINRHPCLKKMILQFNFISLFPFFFLLVTVLMWVIENTFGNGYDEYLLQFSDMNRFNYLKFTEISYLHVYLHIYLIFRFPVQI